MSKLKIGTPLICMITAIGWEEVPPETDGNNKRILR